MAVVWVLGVGPVRAQSSYRQRPVVSSSIPTPTTWSSPVRSKPVASTIVPVRYQLRTDTDERPREYKIQLEPPGLERISRLDSDAKLQERIRQETKEQDPSEIVMFPEEPILSRDAYNGRANMWPRRNMLVEPNYTCFGRLYFQDLNAERYGWDFGPLHPFVSTAKFFYDLALWPAHFAHDPCGRDCNSGYCLPGDPTPFLLYPPDITVRGSIAEVAVILALIAVFP